jgi:hypothetical protein
MVLLTPRAWSGLARDGARRLALHLGLCVLLVVGGAGYWLGRNWIATGNPIYPSRVRVAGITVLDGPKEIKSSTRQQEWFVDSAAGWLGYPFRETFNDVPRYTLENGFGPLFAAGSLAALAALAAALTSGRWLEVRAHLAIPLTALCFVVVNPYKEPRYVIALCGFAVLGVAWVAERARAAGPTARRGLEMAVVAAIVFAALGGAVSVAPHLDRVVADWKRGTWSPERFYVLEYGAAGEAFNWVAENLRGETVSFTQSAFVAPLFGWHGTNRVIYASTGRDERIGRVPRVRHYGAWRRFLRENDVAWIVQWVPWWSGEGPTDRDAWIASHPEGFHLVREFEGRARIWQPIFGAGDAEAEAAPGIADLGRAATWRLEHTEGATVEVEGGGDGLRVRFTFGTSGNDWGDLRADLDGADWSASRAFAFDLDGETTTPAQLFVWLKGEEPRRAARYRVDASSLGRGPRRVEIPLGEPEWAAPGFTLRDVSEVHVVFEDEDDASRGEGRLVVTGFRLEPRQGIAAVPRPVEKNP